MKKILVTLIAIFGFGSVAFAVPYYSSTQTMVPFVDSSYDIGTSTAAYRNFYIDRICLNTDCQTSWPAGGSGSFSWTPFPNYNATSSNLSMPGLIVTSTSTFPYLGSGIVGLNNGRLYGGATTTFSGGLLYSNGGVTDVLTAGDGITRNTNDFDLDIPVLISSGGTGLTSLTGDRILYSNDDGTVIAQTASSTLFGVTTPGYVWSYQNGSWGAFATSSSGGSGATFGQTFEVDSSNWISATTTGTYGINANAQGLTYGFGIGGQLLAYASSTNTATIFGIEAGGNNATTTATSNQTTALGYRAARLLTTGQFNTIVGGVAAASLTTGGNNVIVGDNGPSTSNASNNTSIGHQAPARGTGNVTIGSIAGQNVSTGTYNILTGYQAGSSITSGSNNIIFGQNVDIPNGNSSSKLNIANVLYGTNIGGSGTITSNPTVNATIGISTSTPFAQFAISALSGSTYPGNNLFLVASSTGTATTTLFSINNTGQVYSSGNAGIGTTSPSSLLSVHGNQYTSGTSFFGGVITSTSTAALSITGNAGTATALFANGANCSAGNYPLGVDASGAVENCTPDAGAFAWTPNATGFFNQIANSTTTQIHFGASPISLTASSTAWFDRINVGSTTSSTMATSTFYGNIEVKGNLRDDSISSALLFGDGIGEVVEYTGTSCTNQFVRSLDATGQATCATVGAADVSLANLTATDATLTFSGTYNGSTARTIGLNLANANAWSGVQTFTNGFVSAATSTFSWLGTGGVAVNNGLLYNAATSTLSTITGTLAIAKGGTGLTSITGDRLLYTNDAGTALLEVATSSLSIGGNAGTATALFGNPTDCGSDTWATTIAASGNLTCSAITNIGGGTGKDSSAWTGFAGVFDGLWSAVATSTTAKLSLGAITTTYASTTQMSSGTNTFYIDSNGRVQAKDTTNGWTGVVSPTRSFVLETGTTTSWTASTTGTAYSSFITMPFTGTLRQIRCITDASFLGVNIQVNGSNAAPSYFVGSTTVGVVSFTGSNTFTAGQKILANFGTTTSATTKKISCTLDATET